MKRQRGDSSSFTGKATGKRRKSYVVHKERETWTDEEHAKFVLALEKHGRAWTKIEEVVGTKTVSQIRSHAQKYFEKIEKQGDMEIVRPADGNALIEVPWIALPDVLAEKKFLLDRGNFQAWMEKNHLGAPRPLPPPDLLGAETTQTQQAISFLDRAAQTLPLPSHQSLLTPQIPSLHEKEPDENKGKSVNEGDEINWNRIMKYISGIARESLDPTSISEVTIHSLSAAEKEVLRAIMTQNIAAVSIDSIRVRIERFMCNFDRSVNPPLSSPSSPFTTPSSSQPPLSPNSTVFRAPIFPGSNAMNLASIVSAPVPPNLTNSMELFSNFVQESSVDSSRNEKA